MEYEITKPVVFYLKPITRAYETPQGKVVLRRRRRGRDGGGGGSTPPPAAPACPVVRAPEPKPPKSGGIAVTPPNDETSPETNSANLVDRIEKTESIEAVAKTEPRAMSVDDFVAGVAGEWPEIAAKIARRPFLHPGRRMEVRYRDGGRCAHVGASGERCNSRENLQIHHIREIAHGGTNDLANLVTLCWKHHQERHPSHRINKFPRSWLIHDHH